MKKTLRTALSAILALVMLVSVIPMTVVAAYKTPFEDVKAEDYFYEAVIWAYTEGVTTGTSATKFAPEKTCTRGQVVAFLWRAMGKPEPASSENPFEDVKSSDYYFKPILWAVEKGITTGTSAKRFSPDTTCTNAHILTFIWRALGEPGKTGEGEWYADAEKWANGAAILDGTYTGEYDVTAGCPRANVVTYLYRYMTDGKLTLYVSAGADAKTADGSAQKPFPTIEAARNYIRTLNKAQYKGIDVRVAKGNYMVKNTITFDAKDGGTKDCPVRYIGEDEAVLSGGTFFDSGKFKAAEGDVTKYFPDDARSKILMLDLKEYGFTEAMFYGSTVAESASMSAIAPLLYANGELCTIARYPNEGMLHMKTGEINAENGEHGAKDFETTTSIHLSDEDFAHASAWHNTNDTYVWGRFSALWCTDNSNVISFNKDKDNEMLLWFAGGHDPRPDMPYYFYNVPEELDVPGEYFVDRNCILYYYPTDDISDLRFGITSLDANMIEINGADYLTFEGLTFEQSNKDIIVAEGADNFTLKNCTLRAATGECADLAGEHITVEGCEFSYSGGSCLTVRSGDIDKLIESDSIVFNNLFHDWAYTGRCMINALELRGCGVTASHNEFCNSNEMAIGWGECVLAVVEYNYIHDVCQLFDDGGASSTGFVYLSYGTEIRYNLYENVGDPDNVKYGLGLGVNAVSLDMGTTGNKVYGNIFYKVTGGGVAFTSRDNKVLNNLAISCRKGVAWMESYAYDIYNQRSTYQDDAGALEWESYAGRFAGSPAQNNEYWAKRFPNLLELDYNLKNADKFQSNFCAFPYGVEIKNNFVFVDKTNYLESHGTPSNPYIKSETGNYYVPYTITQDCLKFADVEEPPMVTYSPARTDYSVEYCVGEAEETTGITVEMYKSMGRVEWSLADELKKNSKSVSTIVAMGGGESPRIFKYVLDLVPTDTEGRKNHCLYIGTASNDNKEGYLAVARSFALHNCQTKALNLVTEKYTDAEINELLDWADVVYVGGGDTYAMMCIWREQGFDKILRERYEEGRIVFSGSSAGGCCWFDYGYSDSASAQYKAGYSCGLVEGLGFISGVFCPHYSGRGAEFEERFKNNARDGYGLDDNTAVVFNGVDVTYLSCDYGFEPAIYVYHNSSGKLVKEAPAERVILE